MKNSPAFQFFVRDWLSDQRVRLMTVSQRGIYIDLLCFCWEGDGLPVDHKAIGKIANLSRSEVANDLPVVLKHFANIGDKLHHGRLIKQKDYQSKRSQKKSDNANARWTKHRDSHEVRICETDALAMQPHMHPHCDRNAINAVAVAVAVEELLDKLCVSDSQPKEKQTRSANLHFDAVCEVCQLDPALKATGGKVGRVLKEMQPLAVTPDEIRVAGELFALQHPLLLIPKFHQLSEMIPIVRNPALVAKIRSNRNGFQKQRQPVQQDLNMATRQADEPLTPEDDAELQRLKGLKY